MYVQNCHPNKTQWTIRNKTISLFINKRTKANFFYLRVQSAFQIPNNVLLDKSKNLSCDPWTREISAVSWIIFLADFDPIPFRLFVDKNYFRVRNSLNANGMYIHT